MRVFFSLVVLLAVGYSLFAEFRGPPKPSETVGQRAERECRIEASADSRKDCIDAKIIGAALSRQK